MSQFPSLRWRLVGTVFLAILPAWVVIYLFAYDPPWMRLVLGVLALGAAWVGGERFVMRQVRRLLWSTRLLAGGDLTARTGMDKDPGELGDLARNVDAMAAALEEKVKERELVEKALLTRALQQTVVSALGQFGLSGRDFPSLVNQAVMLAQQTLEVEYTQVLELEPNGEFMWLRAGLGWKAGLVGNITVSAAGDSQNRFALQSGSPVVVEDLSAETRFEPCRLLIEHGVVSGVMVAIRGQNSAFGVFGAHTTRERKFTEDEVHFLLAISAVLAMAVERSRVEKEMEKLASFAQLNPNAAMELSADGAITYFNEAALRLAASVGQEHPRVLLPENLGPILDHCLGTGESWLKLGTTFQKRNLSWSFHPVPASRVVHAYVEDITDRLNLEAQLRQSQKMESVGQLAAGVAHDFNNMLTIIQGHAGLLLAKADLPETARGGIQAINFAAERAVALTRQLLMFSRKNVMQPRLLDLREIISNMSKMLQRLLGETIRLQYTPAARMPLVEGDAGMIEQVIMNLAVNARDAMPRGGTLSISAEPAQIGVAHVAKYPEARAGEFVCLKVEDTGCGMDAATLGRIFEPFFTTKEVGKGTGLGLATVYGIVKQHEGWIEVASQVGKGAVFTVYLPASHKRAQETASQIEPSPAACGGKETILIVEDEPVLRDMAEVILADSGYTVLCAGNGTEALQVWEQHRDAIDLVMTDLVMPENMSGMDLAQRLRASKPTLKIIFASGYSMDDLDTEFLRRGKAVFLQKPYTHAILKRVVRECLDTAKVEPADAPA